jgi:hypothetical protein
MDNRTTDAIEKKIEKCGKVITKFVKEPGKREGLYKAMASLNKESEAKLAEIDNNFEEEQGKVISERNKKIDGIKKNAAGATAGKDETEKLYLEANVNIESGKQMKAVLDEAEAKMGKINDVIYKQKKDEIKKYDSKRIVIVKEAVGTKDRAKEIVKAMGEGIRKVAVATGECVKKVAVATGECVKKVAVATGEIVGKALYAVKNEPINATVGTALVAVGVTVATGPVGVMTGIGAVTAGYGAITLWKCGPAYVTLKNYKKLVKYEEEKKQAAQKSQ